MCNKKKKEAELKAKEAKAAEEARKAEEEKKAQEEQPSRPTAMEEYYNIAYVEERKRLDDIFGKISYPDKKEVVYVTTEVVKEPDPKKYVKMRRFKKKSGLAAAFGVLFGIFLATTVALLLNHFNIIALPF